MQALLSTAPTDSCRRSSRSSATRSTWTSQHRRAARSTAALNVGGGYRHSADDTTPSPLLRFEPEDRAHPPRRPRSSQDEIALTPTVTAIVGAKVERNDYTGVEWQPSGRVALDAGSGNHTRVGGRLARGAAADAVRHRPAHSAAASSSSSGNPDFDSETVVAYEAGYRAAPAPCVGAVRRVFHNRYDDLRTQELPGGRVVVGNGLNDQQHWRQRQRHRAAAPWARVTRVLHLSSRTTCRSIRTAATLAAVCSKPSTRAPSSQVHGAVRPARAASSSM